MPPEIDEWLARLLANQDAFKLGAEAVVIRLRNRALMEMVSHDEVLGKLCTPVDGRTIMVLSSNLSRVAKRLKELEYVLA